MDWKQNYYEEMYHAGIKGMKWGVRRYQNLDGSLTEAGKKRYASDTKNMSEKQKSKYAADPDKWVKEDMERTKGVADAGKNLSDTLDRAVQNTRTKKERMDLSAMSDQEMRNKINREMLERQYNDMFASNERERGKKAVSAVLQTVGTTLGIVGSALQVAIWINQLKKS